MRQWHKHQSCGVWGDCWHVICTLCQCSHTDWNMKLLTILHSPTPTPPHSYTHTPTHIYPLLKMPISAEQWRASVGAANASRRPFQVKRRWPCWEVFLCLLAALLVSILLPGGGWKGTGSRSEYQNRSCILSQVSEWVTATIIVIVGVNYCTTKRTTCSILSVHDLTPVVFGPWVWCFACDLATTYITI